MTDDEPVKTGPNRPTGSPQIFGSQAPFTPAEIQSDPQRGNSTDEQVQVPRDEHRFNPDDYGGKEVCIIVSASKLSGRLDLAKLARVLTHKGKVRYTSARSPYVTPLDWIRNSHDGFKHHVDRQRCKAKEEGCWDSIPAQYCKNYGW